MEHMGLYDVMGQPITMVGELTILDSEVIDHANDNVPLGVITLLPASSRK